MTDRYLTGKLSRSLVVALILALSAAWLAPAAATAAGLDKLDTSLKLIPDDAAFYTTMLRNREQYEAVAKSNAVARLKDMPIVKMGLLLYKMQANDPEGPVGQFKAALKDPEVKKLIDLLVDMVDDEVFFYGDESFTGFMGLMQQINAGNQTAPLVALFSDKLDPADPTRAQAAVLLEILANNIDRVKVPEMVIGFKISNTKSAARQLDKLEKLATDALKGEPKLKSRLKRTKVAGHEYLTLSLDGSLFPWGELPLDDLEKMELDEGSAKKVIDRLKKETLVVALGVRDDYVLLSIGATTDALAKLGKGKRLIDRPEFKPLAKFANKRLVSIGYASAEFNAQAGNQQLPVDELVKSLDEILPGSGLPKKDQQQIRKDATALAKDINGLLPVPGAIMSFGFLTNQGIEGYSYNWAKNLQYDGSKPLGLLKHVGGSPAMAIVARGKYAPEQYDLAVKWVKIGYGYFEKYALPEMSKEEQKQARKFIKLVTPLLKRADDANRKLLIPALKDGQVAVVVDTQLKSKQFAKDLPETEKPMPMIEPAIVVGISDAKLLKKACDEYQEIFDGLVEVIREMEPDAIPKKYKIPRPKETKSDAGEIFTYAAPKEWGLDKKIALTLGLSDNVGVIAASRKHAQRLLAATPLKAGGVLKNPDRPMAVAGFFDWAGLVTAAQPWIDLAVEQVDAGSEEEEAATVSQVQTVVDVLKVIRKVTSESRFEDDVLVTHTLLEIRDVEEK